jgi:hypothetical protein
MPEYIKIFENFDKQLSAELKKEQGELSKLLNAKAIFSLTMGEVIGKIEEKSEVLFNIWYAMSIYPWNAFPSKDNNYSIGAFQMRKSTYLNLLEKINEYTKKHGLKNTQRLLSLPKTFEECESFYCQAKAAILLNYFEVKNAEKVIFSNKEIKEMWKNANEEEKERFLLTVISAIHNLGLTNFQALWKDFLKEREKQPIKNNNEINSLAPVAAIKENKEQRLGIDKLETLNNKLIEFIDRKYNNLNFSEYANSNYGVYIFLKKLF